MRFGRDNRFLDHVRVRIIAQVQQKLFVSNASSEPVHLALEERIPVSEVKEVEVSLRAKDTRPAPSEVTKDGIVRFVLELPAREHREVTLAYDVSASAKVAGI